MDLISIALIAGGVSVAVAICVSAFMSVMLLGKHRARDRQEDQDDRRQVRETLKAQNVKANMAAVEIKGQLSEIHTLVNSQLTEAKQAELDSARLLLIMAQRVVARDEREGAQPGKDDLSILAATQAKIKHLEGVLKDRAVQQAIIDAG